jgi:hypothetical protein
VKQGLQKPGAAPAKPKDHKMKNRLKLSAKFLTVNGNRAGVQIVAGPWIAGVPAELIKLRAKRGAFPAGFRAALSIENNSDSREDYFEADCIRLMPGHPLYAVAKAAAA